jgi:hypothetical protein
MFPGALKRSFPRINAEAPTTNPEARISHAVSVASQIVASQLIWHLTPGLMIEDD